MISCNQKTHTISLYKEKDFDTIIDNKQIKLFTLKNKEGITLQVTNFGCRVVALWTPDKNHNFKDIVLGYENIKRYINNTGERFLGATIGRYGNRIANGEFELDGITYKLSTFNNGQCLHGGDKGFDMVIWDVNKVCNNSIEFSYFSKDMEEGFPGNLKIDMKYSLTDDNTFRIEYKAKTDKNTPVNLTHHSFFNLKGEGEGSINDNILCINANYYTPVNEVLIPTGEIIPVNNTPFDFRNGKKIGTNINEDNQQLINCKGYDHNFVLNRKTKNELEFAASVYEPQSGRYLEVWTTEPGLQFYGGNFFNGKTIGKSGKEYKYREAFALETQHFPDSPNQKNFPNTILKPNEIYSQTCEYRFYVK